MSHLKKITFNNFRVFEKKTSFDIRPITFLTGPNSSGKSSVLKSLLLLKSNFNSDLQVLDFSGSKHNLGTFENTINKSNEVKDLMSFGFQASVSNMGFPFSFLKEPRTTKRSVYHILKEFKSESYTDVYIELSYVQNERSGKLSSIELSPKEGESPFIKFDISSPDKEYHTLKIDIDKIQKNKIVKDIIFDNAISVPFKVKNPKKIIIIKYPTIFSIQENSKMEYYDEPILVFSKLYEQFIKEYITLDRTKPIHNFLLGQPIRRLLRDFASIIENTEYLEAVRANTKRLYTNDSQGTSFNDLILDYRSREISTETQEFTNKWLKKFEIADELIFENIEGVATTIYLKRNDEKIALADLGYGITQFLPILLKIALEEPIKKNKELTIVKKLILLEEPETNLHPKLQSLIADFLIDAIKMFEVRFIIETHSEYIIRKIQILTAEKEIASEDSIIYYFSPKYDNEENKIIEININKNGSLDSDFGSGFFDEATNLKFELLKLKSVH